jgi:ABC-type polysaccharide/polyol phosphate transport system ATPase subunit
MRRPQGSFGRAVSSVFSNFARLGKGKGGVTTPNLGENRRTGVEDVLRTEQITMSFGPVVALRNINLRVRRSEVLGLVGDNGAGKSTLVKILSGLYKPSG